MLISQFYPFIIDILGVPVIPPHGVLSSSHHAENGFKLQFVGY